MRALGAERRDPKTHTYGKRENFVCMRNASHLHSAASELAPRRLEVACSGGLSSSGRSGCIRSVAMLNKLKEESEFIIKSMASFSRWVAKR